MQCKLCSPRAQREDQGRQRVLRQQQRRQLRQRQQRRQGRRRHCHCHCHCQGEGHCKQLLHAVYCCYISRESLAKPPAYYPTPSHSPPTHTHTTNPLSNCACLCRSHTLSAACPLSRCFLCCCCCCWRHCSIELDSARDAGSGSGGEGEADRQQTVTRLVG